MPAAARRRSSARSRANTREDDEGDDQHGGEAGKPYRGLSNEIIHKIYNQLFAAEHTHSSRPGLREILVSKRIYSVARPAYLHTIVVSSCELTTESVIAGLLCDEKACSAVRTLDITVSVDHERTTAALFARLPNLQILKLSFDRDYWVTGGFSDPLSEFFLRQLARIPRLRQLDLAGPVCFDSDVSVCAPPIRHVSAALHSITPAFSTFFFRQSGIERLIISVDEIPAVLELGDLPWASLRYLVTVFETYEEPSSTNSRLIDFLGAQLAKYRGSTPLRTLTIAMNSKIDGFVAVVRSAFSTFAPRGVTDFCFQIAEYPLLFALLSFVARTSVTTLIVVPKVERLQKQYKWKRLSRDKPFRLE